MLQGYVSYRCIICGVRLSHFECTGVYVQGCVLYPCMLCSVSLGGF